MPTQRSLYESCRLDLLYASCSPCITYAQHVPMHLQVRFANTVLLHILLVLLQSSACPWAGYKRRRTCETPGRSDPGKLVERGLST
jgi:hypothetical protein